MKLALVGLAGSGKTCIYNALTGSHEAPGTGGRSAEHLAILKVPERRLDWLAVLNTPPKVTQATIEVLDLPGLGSTGAAGGAMREGTVGIARAADALVLVLRQFTEASYPYDRPEPDPLRDLEDVRAELILADLGIAEKRVERLRKDILKPKPDKERDIQELAYLERVIQALDDGHRVREVEATDEERLLGKGYSFLTEKPWVALVSRDEPSEVPVEVSGVSGYAEMCGLLEMEIGELDADERNEFMQEMGLDRMHAGDVIQACYGALDIVTFFTEGPTEVRAWTVRRGSTAVDAAASIHTDLARGFIRAETVAFEDLEREGSMKAVKAAGLFRLEGKSYVVKDGDILLIRFSV
jgi:ribosome-binding ATPase